MTGIVYLKFHLKQSVNSLTVAGDLYSQSSLSLASAAQEVNSNDTIELLEAQYKELYFFIVFFFYR